jgi:N-acylneuraminate cytidylyltransferase
MIWWSLQAAYQSISIDKIIVATDCDQIAEVVAGFGMDNVEIYRRDDQNAQDDSSTESVMLEYINKSDLSDDTTFLLLQATSVFTRSQDINAGLEAYNEQGVDSVLSCVESKQFFWSAEGRSLNYDYKSRPRRQDFEGQLIENGAFYINSVKSVKESGNRLSGNIRPVIMPHYSSIELDEPHDWIIAESIMQQLIDSNS